MALHFSEQPILKDFDRFITYLCERPALPLTNDKVVLKGGDSLAINEQMTSFQTTFVTARHPMKVFTLVNTFFYIAQTANLFFVNTNKSGKNIVCIKEENIRAYDALTDAEKYFFLLETFWCHIDWYEAYEENGFWAGDFYRQFVVKPTYKKITIADINLKRKGQMNPPEAYFAAEMFQAFGLIDMTWDDTLTARPSRYFFPCKDMTLLPLGKIILSVLVSDRPHYKWRRCDNLMNFSIIAESQEKGLLEPSKFTDAFLPFFEGLTLEKRLIEFPLPPEARECVAGCYELKVSVTNKIYRTIRIAGTDSFDDLHDAIQAAFDFDNDHLYAFFMDGKRWSRNGETYWSPMNDEGILADEVEIGTAGLTEGKKFLYLFDFGDEWQFSVQVLAIKTEEKEPDEWSIIESVGDAPSQYGDEDEDDEDDW
jgi:hypothetical protein